MKTRFKVYLTDDTISECASKQDVFNHLKKSNDICVLYRNTPSTASDFEKKAAQSLDPSANTSNICLSFSITNDCSFTNDLDEWIENEMLDIFYYEDRRPYIEEILV